MEDIVWTHLREVLQRLGDYFVHEAQNNLLTGGNPPYPNSNASGTLTNSLKYNVEIDNAHFEVSVELEDYWYYVENGRKAGKMPPIDKIAEWVRVKRIVPQVREGVDGKKRKAPTVEQLAFLIARKIGNEGVEGTKFFSKAKEDTLSYFKESISLAIQEDIGDFVKDVLATKIL